MNDNSRNPFDSFAENYRSIHSKNLKITGADSEFFCEYKIIEVAKKFKKNQQGIILDFGCGDGTSSYFFRKYFPQYTIIGIDISAESIKAATKKKIINCEFKIFDGLKVPSDDNTFVIVFIANVLHHIPFYLHRQVLNECCRVLKNNGMIFIFEHNPINPVTRKIFNDCIFDKDAKLVYHSYMKKQIRSAGFSKVKTSYHLFFPRFKIFKFFHYLEKYLNFIPIGGQYCIWGEKR